MADITIDSLSISTQWHGDVLDYEVGQNEMSDMVLTTSFNPRPIPLAGTIGSKRISLVIDFRKNGSDTADQAISTFMEYLVSKNESASYIELNLQDGFGYTCSFYSADTPERKTSSITQCKVTLVGFRHKPEVTYTKDVGNMVGTISENTFGSCRRSPLYVKYSPPTGTVNFTLKLDGVFIHCKNISSYIEIGLLTICVIKQLHLT